MPWCASCAARDLNRLLPSRNRCGSRARREPLERHERGGEHDGQCAATRECLRVADGTVRGHDWLRWRLGVLRALDTVSSITLALRCATDQGQGQALSFPRITSHFTLSPGLYAPSRGRRVWTFLHLDAAKRHDDVVFCRASAFAPGWSGTTLTTHTVADFMTNRIR